MDLLACTAPISVPSFQQVDGSPHTRGGARRVSPIFSGPFRHDPSAPRAFSLVTACTEIVQRWYKEDPEIAQKSYKDGRTGTKMVPYVTPAGCRLIGYD